MSIRRSIRRLFRRWRKRQVSARARQAALKQLKRFPLHRDAPRHGLPGDLVVSLTSYPRRFPTLALTIKSLLDQTVKPDRVILWLGQGARGSLPKAVTDLEGARFEVRTTDDLRSFTKIIPALDAFPRAFIAVADDDIYYRAEWLESLIDGFDPEVPAIVYHRGHRITHLPDGRLAPHRTWEREVSDARSLKPSIDIMPTGVGGVLYPPGSLPQQTSDIALFKRLSPTCDDSWLYFMWRQNGWTATRVDRPREPLITWPDTQEESLMTLHRGGGKDAHLAALSAHFGAL